MDGKLLILCDELPKDYEHYSVKDVYFLRSKMIDPDDDPERLFVTWEAVIPTDRTFIDTCYQSAREYKEMPIEMRLKQTGKIDSKHGNIKGSIQEDSFINVLDANIKRIRMSAANGEDAYAEALDLSVQYPMQATGQFLWDFSSTLNNNEVVRILPTHSSKTSPEIIQYRTFLLEA